jgi:hypothetical protein
MQFNSSTRNHIFKLLNNSQEWLSTPFIATTLHAELGCTTPLSEDVIQLEAFLHALPEVEESVGRYRLKAVA